jgi:hypothetical protein
MKHKENADYFTLVAVAVVVIVVAFILGQYIAGKANAPNACRDQFALCPDGTRYLKSQCTGGQPNEVRYFADPCLGHAAATPTPAVASPTAVPTAPASADVTKNPAAYACAQSIDCVLAQQGCCGCEMGGKSVAINSNYLDDWKNRFAASCAGIACTAMYACGGLRAVCVSGTCQVASANASAAPTETAATPIPGGFDAVSSGLSKLVYADLSLTKPCVDNSYYGSPSYYCSSQADTATGIIRYYFSLQSKINFKYEPAAGFLNANISGRQVHVAGENKSGEAFTDLEFYCNDYAYRVASYYPTGIGEQQGLAGKLLALCS